MRKTEKDLQNMPIILLTNDDGFYAEGIEILFGKLKDLGRVYIVAPDQEKSAASLSITLHHPLRIKTIKDDVFAVSGTPADCIYLALQKILPRKPDLIISGINHGPNLGQQDISYSGTVAGAIQGTFLQVQSLAVSLMPEKTGRFAFEFAGDFIYKLTRHLLQNKLPEGITLNINIPPPPIKGIKVVKLGQKRYNPEIVVKKDPRGRTYYWIGTGHPKEIGDEDSDVIIFKEGYLTISPLHTDRTDFRMLESSAIETYFSWIQNETF